MKSLCILLFPLVFAAVFAQTTQEFPSDSFEGIPTSGNEFLVPMKKPHSMTETPKLQTSEPNESLKQKTSNEPEYSELELEKDLESSENKPKSNEKEEKPIKIDRFQALEETLRSYLSPPPQNRVSKSAYSWQENVNYIEPVYLRTFVRKLVSSRPIASWPTCVKTLVFPQVFSYYPVSVLKPQLIREYKSVVQEDKENRGSKVDLLEKLMKLEELKKKVEIAILDQTEKLLEARKYDERTEKLMRYLQNKEEKIPKVDEMLEAVDK